MSARSATMGGRFGYATQLREELRRKLDAWPNPLESTMKKHSHELRRRTIPLLAVLLLVATPCTGQSRPAVLDSLLAETVYSITVTETHLDGPGADLLREATSGTHFVGLAESHNSRAIPEFVVGMFHLLQEAHAYEYLALEEGPALGRLLSEAVQSGDLESASTLGRRFPNAFHFYTEEYLRMIDLIGAHSRAESDPIWGLNHEFALAHVMDRLVQIAPNSNSRAIAERLLKHSLKYEGERHARDTSFIQSVVTVDDFRALRQAFRPQPKSEAYALIQQAELSHGIYGPYTKEPRPHIKRFHESSVLREQNMKKLFTERYREAQMAGDSVPKVLVLSGHSHLARGRGLTEVFTLGNFLYELATFQQTRSLLLYVVLNWEDLSDSWLAPFVPLIPAGSNAVFDLRPLEGWAAHGQLGTLDGRLNKLLLGYDMLVILQDTSQASVEGLCTPDFNWYVGIRGCP